MQRADDMRPEAKIPQLIVAAVLMLASASMSLAQQGAVAGPLTGSEWRVEDIGGVGAGADSRANISIAADGALSGSGGCNRLMGRADIKGEALTFAPVATTRMACALDIMQRERKLLDALQATRSYRITGAALTLHDAAGAELMRLARRG
jgi:putative lipoprotein